MSARAALLSAGWPRPTPSGAIALVAAASVGLTRPIGALGDLLLAFLIALLAGAYLLAWRAGVGGLEVRRLLPAVATKGEALTVVHLVTHGGGGVLHDLALTELPREAAAEPGLAGSGTYFPQVLPGLVLEARTRLFVGRRGRLALDRLAAVTGDPFGLFTRTATLALPAEVLVRPRPERAAAAAALAHARRRGALGGALAEAPEWAGVREGRSGDPLRLVHWRLTARRGAPIVRLLEQERPGAARLVLDRRLAGRRPRALAELEQAIALTAGLGLELLGRGHEVELAAAAGPGEEAPLRLTLRGGEGRTRLLDALALITPLPPEGAAPPGLAGAVVVTARPEVERALEPGAVVIEAGPFLARHAAPRRAPRRRGAA